MKKSAHKGRERRKFTRLHFTAPLAYKVCKKKTISKLLQGYTSNISQAGLLCKIEERVHKNDLLWLAFDRSNLAICEQLEKESFIYQNGVIGKVVRLERKKDGTYDVGIQFLTRKEKNLTHIYPQIYFLKKKGTKEFRQEDEDEDAQAEEKLEEEPQESEEDKIGEAEIENQEEGDEEDEREMQ